MLRPYQFPITISVIYIIIFLGMLRPYQFPITIFDFYIIIFLGMLRPYSTNTIFNIFIIIFLRMLRCLQTLPACGTPLLPREGPGVSSYIFFGMHFILKKYPPSLRFSSLIRECPKDKGNPQRKLNFKHLLLKYSQFKHQNEIYLNNIFLLKP
jgi:hypothetical protein